MSYRSLGIVLAVACALLVSRTATAGCGTCDKTVVENAANNESFSTLVAAVKAAGLAETLSGSGPFTVFAPTNAAFEKLPAGTVEKLRVVPFQRYQHRRDPIDISINPDKIMSRS